MSAKTSDLASNYEQEILSLPFDEQRYPAADLARKQCGVYQESVQHANYDDLLSSVGFSFSPDNLDFDDNPGPFGDKFISLLREGAGEGVRYIGLIRPHER